MPTYEIEQYELHTSKFRVEADSDAEAIAKLFDGEGEAVDQSLEFIEVADDHGMPVNEFRALTTLLRDLGVSVGNDVIQSIRTIEEV